MVADFICEEVGFLELTDEEYARTKAIWVTPPADPNHPADAVVSVDYFDECPRSARVKLEIGKGAQGYNNFARFKLQIQLFLFLFHVKWPHRQAVVCLDHSGKLAGVLCNPHIVLGAHKTHADDALCMSAMNLREGGSKPLMRDTEFVDKHGNTAQSCTHCFHANASPGNTVRQTMSMEVAPGVMILKGLLIVLRERGAIRPTQIILKEVGASLPLLHADCCLQEAQRLLSEYPDFKNASLAIEDEMRRWGDIPLFIPKFHCELNPIERVWASMKKHLRSMSDGMLVTLRAALPGAWQQVTLANIRKFFRKAWDWLYAYEQGLSSAQAMYAVKTYKSHRRLLEGM